MSENERDHLQEIILPIEWHVPEQIQNRYAHNVIVQPGSHELTLFFFETQIPPFTGSPEEIRTFLTKQSSIRSECIGKITVSPELVPEIIKALQTGLDGYRRMREHGKEG